MASKTGTELYFLNEQGPRLAGFAPANMNVVVRSALPEDALAQRDPAGGAGAGSDAAGRQAADDGPGVRRCGGAAALPRRAARRSSPAWRWRWRRSAPTASCRTRSASGRKEIGIHMALGATRGSVLGMVLGQGMRLTIVGLVAGLVASFGLTRLLQAQLFNVKPTDPATLSGVAVFIAVVAFDRLLRAGAARDARRSDGDACGSRRAGEFWQGLRSPWLFVAQRAHRIDLRGAVRGHAAPRQGRPRPAEPRTATSVAGSHAFISYSSDVAALADCDRARQTRRRRRPASSAPPAAASSRRTRDGARAERHAQADLARPLRHRVGEHAVEADRRQQRRQTREQRQTASSSSDRGTCCRAPAASSVFRSSSGRFGSSRLHRCGDRRRRAAPGRPPCGRRTTASRAPRPAGRAGRRAAASCCLTSLYFAFWTTPTIERVELAAVAAP